MPKQSAPSLEESRSAPIRTVASYLTHSNRRLVIPPWQREYVWQVGENGEVGEFMSDLKEFVESDGDEYLLGSVILCEEPKGSNQFWLIDGQQRTLTLLIFLMAAKRWVTNAKLKEVNNTKHERISVIYHDAISHSATDYMPRVNMDRGKADDILQSIYLWSGMAEGEKPNELLEERDHWTVTQKNLANTAEWIYEKQFKTQEWSSKENFLKNLEKLLLKVKLIEIELPSPSEALIVFDRVNNRGADLNSSDLIKNIIFQHVDDEKFSEISDSWQLIRGNLATCSMTRMREPQYLLRTLALERLGLEDKTLEEEIHEKGKKITYNQLYRFWGARLDPKAEISKGVVGIKPDDLIKEMIESSDWLARLSEERRPSPKKVHYRDLYLLRYLKIVQHYPILIAGRNLEEKVFAHLVKQVAARTSYYYLAGERNQEFETMVPEWTYKVAKLDKDAEIKDLQDIYKSFRVSKDQFKILEENVKMWSYKDGTEKKKIRAVLSELSRVLDGICGKENKLSPEFYFETATRKSKFGWDIEHIRSKGREPRGSIVHSIGNLVLLHPIDNRSKGKAASKDKALNYGECPLILTKSLVGVKSNPDKRKVEKHFQDIGVKSNFKVGDWTDQQISQRTDFYYKLLKTHIDVQ